MDDKDISLDQLKCICLRCGHLWYRKYIDKKPRVCPSPDCHSSYWDLPRVRVKKSKQGI